MYNPVAFSKCTIWCEHAFHLVLKHFQLLLQGTVCLQSVIPHSSLPFPSASGNQQSAFCLLEIFAYFLPSRFYRNDGIAYYVLLLARG